ncbi:MAG: aminopeptidase P family protein [Muribaculaceae bacterium]|nr:aminopeptidase P family protein [Muribaculaceae bacterium]
MFSRQTYIDRRRQLKDTVGSGILLFLGNQDAPCNFADNGYRFRQDSTFMYYFDQPYAGLNAIIDIDNDREIIFGDELTIDYIVWMGNQPTIHEKAAAVGVDETMPSAALREYLDKARAQGRTIHYLPPYRNRHRLDLFELLDIKPGAEQPSVPFIKAVVDMRNHKTPDEVALIERACDVTSDMHLEAMRIVRPGMKEYEVLAAVEAIAMANDCYTSFPTIATINGQTLHNFIHSHTIKPGDMFLLDAGAELADSYYCGDMSSTIPADKRFTARQKAIYDIQVAAHQASVDALKPGVRFEDVYDLSARTTVEGLKALGLMKGDPYEAVAAGAHALFYPTGLGHMMGMDDHDMENLGEVWVGYGGKPKSTQFGRKSLRLARELEPGFVLTIEPGVYFIPELIDLWSSQGLHKDFINYDEVNRWRDAGGVRNEENYLITPDGKRRLGKRIPLTTDEVEAMR